ncbi:MAG: hypothetical protein GTN89_01660 [Acidobacteria bacterium]|nr:hypothetical protein [Acidobacteriota bacterium]NIM61423.1 hypothetical protein [Acidobacteriota bacterium]NIO58086.1 hypothetical protein [Acidobacteriota bacterium]NIQ29095.1 hypothetical protein [Acidobacteriota bacterium]NIQ83639.1 hypothetical protein [Acidobacteriota bacterium]
MRKTLVTVGCSVVVWAALAAPAGAGVQVSFDAETLAMMMRAASTQDVEIPISGDRTLLVQIRDVRLLQLDPAAQGQGRGLIRTAVDVSVPEFDLELSLKPTVVLDVVKGDRFNEFEMRFAELEIPVPIFGEVDIAPFLQPLRYPAEDLWYLAGARGIVHLRSHLVEITMGQKAIRFDFELELTEAPVPQ